MVPTKILRLVNLLYINSSNYFHLISLETKPIRDLPLDFLFYLFHSVFKHCFLDHIHTHTHSRIHIHIHYLPMLSLDLT